jgi:hypothetical protein
MNEQTIIIRFDNKTRLAITLPKSQKYCRSIANKPPAYINQKLENIIFKMIELDYYHCGAVGWSYTAASSLNFPLRNIHPGEMT